MPSRVRCCPVCGTRRLVVHVADAGQRFECPACGAHAAWGNDPQEALENWNARKDMGFGPKSEGLSGKEKNR